MEIKNTDSIYHCNIFPFVPLIGLQRPQGLFPFWLQPSPHRNHPDDEFVMPGLHIHQNETSTWKACPMDIYGIYGQKA